MFLSVSSDHSTHVFMKQPLLTLLLVSFASLSALADSPEAILKDYRKQAAQVVERLNQSLEKAATPMITKLVASGDTAGAELLTAQLKIKLSGEIVPEPQASAAQPSPASHTTQPPSPPQSPAHSPPHPGCRWPAREARQNEKDRAGVSSRERRGL